MTSEKLKPCRNCGSENMHHFSKSDTVECNVCAESSRTAEWQTDTAREKALRADLAAWQAHSAGLAADDVASIKWGCLAGHPVPDEMRQRLQAAYERRDTARAKVEELREGKS